MFSRRDGGVTALCDSCANYSKMNSLRGLNSANAAGGPGGGGGGLPDHRSAASRRAEGGGGGRRVSANVSWLLYGQYIRSRGCVNPVVCRGCDIHATFRPNNI